MLSCDGSWVSQLAGSLNWSSASKSMCLVCRKLFLKMHRILFVHNGPTQFVRLDLDELRKCYDVTECYLRSRWINAGSMWQQVRTHDLVFGWFASWHTFLPLLFARVLGKPSLLVIGGYDLANMP